jgi:hypothetical protein
MAGPLSFTGALIPTPDRSKSSSARSSTFVDRSARRALSLKEGESFMFLFRLVFTLFACAALFWFATMVPLGNRPLWGHLKAISSTREARDLATGTRQEAAKMAERLRQELSSPESARDGGVEKGAHR